MTTIEQSFVFLVCSPILLLGFHIISSRAMKALNWQIPPQKLAMICVLVFNFPIVLLIWVFIFQYTDPASQFWGMVYSILTYNALGHVYFHLYNLSISGIRASLMRKIAKQNITFDDVINQADPANSAERLQRLQDLRIMKRINDRFFLHSYWLFVVGKVARGWGYLLGFDEKDNGYVPSRKK